MAVSKLAIPTAMDIPNKINELIDGYIPTTYLESTVAASTVAKGTFTNVPIMVNALIRIRFTNGNTAASPTIIINGTTYTLINCPAVAQLSAVGQIYSFIAGSTSLSFYSSTPQDICEFGATGIFNYERYANGRVHCWTPAMQTSPAMTSMTLISTNFYYSNDWTVAIPTGMFNSTNYIINPSISSRSYVLSLNPIMDGHTLTAAKFCVIKGGSSTAAIAYKLDMWGTWK